VLHMIGRDSESLLLLSLGTFAQICTTCKSEAVFVTCGNVQQNPPPEVERVGSLSHKPARWLQAPAHHTDPLMAIVQGAGHCARR